MSETEPFRSLEGICLALETADEFKGIRLNKKEIIDAVIAISSLSEITRDVVVKELEKMADAAGEIDSLVLGFGLRDLEIALRDTVGMTHGMTRVALAIWKKTGLAENVADSTMSDS